MAESKEKVWTRICHAEQWPTLASKTFFEKSKTEKTKKVMLKKAKTYKVKVNSIS